MVTKGQSADHPKFLWTNTGHYFQGQPKQRPGSLIDENFWKIIKVCKIILFIKEKKNNSGSDWTAVAGVEASIQLSHPAVL